MKLLTSHIFILSLLLIACDQQRERQSSLPSSSDNSPFSQFQPHNPNSFNADNNRQASDSNSESEAGPADSIGASLNDVTIPQEANHCQWAENGNSGFAAHHQHIGSYTLCQSESDDKVVYIQVKNPIVESNVCLIPTNQLQGTPTYVGEPRCLELKDNEKVYKVEFRKNRTGYSNFTIDGVMIMKDKVHLYPPPYNQYLLGPDAYIYCAQRLSQYGDSSYCGAFDQVGAYVYQRL